MDRDPPKTRTEQKKGRTKDSIYSGKHARLMEARQNGSVRAPPAQTSRGTSKTK